jgi:hypothetical protein
LTQRKEKKIEAGSKEGAEHPYRGFEELQATTDKAYHDCAKPRRPAFVALGKALQAIDKHAPIIDVMIQQQPFFVNLVWGTIRFIIGVSSSVA